MKTLIDACKLVSGSRIGVFAVYDAEKRLLKKAREVAVNNAIALNNNALASELPDVLLMTVNSCMG